MSRVFSTAKQVWSTKSQLTRNIWLAGLGAYDKSYTLANSTLLKSQDVFEHLIARGKQIEEQANSSIQESKQKFADVRHEVQEDWQDKVHKTVTNITHLDTDKFDTILTKIEQVEAALAEVKVQQEVEEQKQAESEKVKSELQDMSAEVEIAQAASQTEAPKPKARRKANTKTPAKKTRKTAAKKTNG